MKPSPLRLTFGLLFPLFFSGQAASASGIDEADRLFRAGEFEAARTVYAGVAAEKPGDYWALLQLGRIALLSNKLDDAEARFRTAIALKPAEASPKVMLAEALYRRDDFSGAASALQAVDVSSNKLLIEQYPTLNVAKLRSFDGETPYEVQGAARETRINLLKIDPLPLLSVRVNGGEEVTFFIDTGGSEVALDTDFAKELGLPQFGKVQGTFAGGEHAEVENTKISSLTLGGFTIKNLPAMTIALRQLSAGFGIKRIDGIIGTALFYHFLTTLDYPKGELVLRRKTAESRQSFAAEDEGKGVAVPIWMASDHFMIGWGQVETLPPSLLFVDSGLASAGVKLAEPVIKQAGIKLDESRASAGAGAAGNLKLVPYTVGRLSLGAVVEENVPGLYDGPFPWESSFGFNLAGMVGHDFLKPYAVTLDFDAMRIVLR